MARIRETVDIVAGRAGRRRRSLDKLVDANSSCDSVKRPIDSMRMELEVLVMAATTKDESSRLS